MNDLPPVVYSTAIKPEWLDYNEHLNVASYVLVFDMAAEAMLRGLGLGRGVARSTGISAMMLESHITYEQEILAGHEVDIRVQLLDHDHKRMHLYFEMRVTGDSDYRAAAQESMAICVDLQVRKSVPFPAAVKAQIEAMSRRQSHLPAPANIGRKIEIR